MPVPLFSLMGLRIVAGVVAKSGVVRNVLGKRLFRSGAIGGAGAATVTPPVSQATMAKKERQRARANKAWKESGSKLSQSEWEGKSGGKNKPRLRMDSYPLAPRSTSMSHQRKAPLRQKLGKDNTMARKPRKLKTILGQGLGNMKDFALSTERNYSNIKPSTSSGPSNQWNYRNMFKTVQRIKTSESKTRRYKEGKGKAEGYEDMGWAGKGKGPMPSADFRKKFRKGRAPVQEMGEPFQRHYPSSRPEWDGRMRRSEPAKKRDMDKPDKPKKKRSGGGGAGGKRRTRRY